MTQTSVGILNDVSMFGEDNVTDVSVMKTNIYQPSMIGDMMGT